jgi:serine/threonine-protein kinase
VVKRLLPGRRYDEEYQAMLMEEARICQRLSHPNIVATYDSGVIDDTPYIAFEFIDGPSLKDCIAQRGAAPIGVALRIALDVARAL